jgi:hypothetical protein
MSADVHDLKVRAADGDVNALCELGRFYLNGNETVVSFPSESR